MTRSVAKPASCSFASRARSLRRAAQLACQRLESHSTTSRCWDQYASTSSPATRTLHLRGAEPEPARHADECSLELAGRPRAVVEQGRQCASRLSRSGAIQRGREPVAVYGLQAVGHTHDLVDTHHIDEVGERPFDARDLNAVPTHEVLGNERTSAMKDKSGAGTSFAGRGELRRCVLADLQP